VFEELLPDIVDTTHDSVVILRLRGRTDLGSTFMDVLRRYAEELNAVDSKLVIISADERIHEQLAVTRVTVAVGSENIYTSDEWVGSTVKRAYADAVAWVADHDESSQD
jgi:SulP family sulfate permease